MIIVYAHNATDFTHNGLAPLMPSVCDVTEELNGAFELALSHHVDEEGRWQFIQEFAIIKAPVPPGRPPQLFRIYKPEKTLSRNFTANARHIFFDSLSDFIETLTATGTVNAIMQAINAARIIMPGRFAMSSDILGTYTFEITNMNPVQAIADSNIGLARKVGGELLRDNFSLALNHAIGHDHGVEIRYRKNLTGIKSSIDVSDVITVIKPIGRDSDGLELPLPEQYVYSPLVGNYPYQSIRVVNFNDVRMARLVWISYGEGGWWEFQGPGFRDKNLLYAELRRLAQAMFANGADLPVVNMTIEFFNLGDTEEYAEYKALETVSLGDIVTVKHEELKIDIKAKVTKYVYDAIQERYKTINVGPIPNNIVKVIGNMNAVSSSALNTIAQIEGGASGGMDVDSIMNTISIMQGQIFALEQAPPPAGGGGGTNIIHNWDFRNPVNQRALTVYSGGFGYCLDRWLRESSATITIASNGVQINSTATGDLSLHQIIEFPTLYLGKTYTISILVNDVLYSGTFTLPGTAPGSTTYYGNVTFPGGTLSLLTIVIGGVFQALYFAIRANYGSFTVQAVKMEVGDNSTLSDDPPVDFGRELEICQRFFEKSYNYSVAPGSSSAYGVLTVNGVNIDGTYIPGFLYRTRKRAIPTVTIYSSTGVLNAAYHSSAIVVNNVMANSPGDFGVRLLEGFTSQPTSGLYYMHYTASADL